MAAYKDAGTQTEWAGLMQRSVRPETLFSAPHDTSTPPEEMADLVTDKSQFAIPHITHSHHDGADDHAPRLPLIERRQGRPGLIARISLPDHEINDEVPLSPPPTHALLSPLPEANTRHAGHTPLIPRARSPEVEAEQQSEVGADPAAATAKDAATTDHVKTVEDDEALSGSLVLPSDPSTANDDPAFISLNALDQELGKIARQQRHLRGDFSDDEDEPAAIDTQRTTSDSQPQQAPAQMENEPPVPRALSSPFLELPGSLNPHSGPSLPPPAMSSPPAQPQAPAQPLSPPAQLVSIDGQEEHLPLSRKGSGDSRRSVATDEVDGVRLKTPPSNFGAPLGHL